MDDQQLAAEPTVKYTPWPACTAETIYDYSFAVRPDPTHPRMRPCRAAFDLFRFLDYRPMMEFTERAFNDFREELAKVGFELLEIERVPHLEMVHVKLF